MFNIELNPNKVNHLRLLSHVFPRSSAPPPTTRRDALPFPTHTLIQLPYRHCELTAPPFNFKGQFQDRLFCVVECNYGVYLGPLLHPPTAPLLLKLLQLWCSVQSLSVPQSTNMWSGFSLTLVVRCFFSAKNVNVYLQSKS